MALPVDSYTISANLEHAARKYLKGDNLGKLFDFKDKFRNLNNRYNNNRITFSEYHNRGLKLEERFYKFLKQNAPEVHVPTSSNTRVSLGSQAGTSGVRQRRPHIFDELGGDDIELNLLPTDDVDIVDLSETGPSYSSTGLTEESLVQPLLEGGAVVGGGSSSTPLIAIGAGSAIVAAGGLIASKAYHSGIQVPGTHYVGPGNPIDSGTPTSGVDSDARDHDISYSHPDTDISASDTRAINKFGDHIAESNLDGAGIIGYVGLQAKKAIEKHTGQLYPKRKRKLLLLWESLVLSQIYFLILYLLISLLKLKDIPLLVGMKLDKIVNCQEYFLLVNLLIYIIL